MLGLWTEELLARRQGTRLSRGNPEVPMRSLDLVADQGRAEEVVDPTPSTPQRSRRRAREWLGSSEGVAMQFEV